MKALRRLALTENDFRGGPIRWALLGGLIALATGVACRFAFRDVVFSAILSTVVGLLVGAIRYGFRETHPLGLNPIAFCMLAGSPRNVSNLILIKWHAYFFVLWWLLLLFLYKFLNQKARPMETVPPLWDAELDR